MANMFNTGIRFIEADTKEDLEQNIKDMKGRAILPLEHIKGWVVLYRIW
jgi:hypothetical protein